MLVVHLKMSEVHVSPSRKVLDDKERCNKRVGRELSKFHCTETFVSKHGLDNNSYCGCDSNLRTINAANPGLKPASPSS